MKRNITYIAAALLALMLYSCFKDNGNYDYNQLDRIGIDVGNNGFLSMKRSQTLDIVPQMTYLGKTVGADQTGNDFTFVWYCNDEEIAQGPALSYPVKDLEGARPYVKLKTTYNKDRSTFLKGFYVDIIAEYQAGWVILTRKDGRSILSYIYPDTYQSYPDFYTDLTGEELGPNATEIKEHWGDLTGAPGNILVLRNDPAGNIDLDGGLLTPMYNTNSFFVGNRPPEDFRPRGEYYMWNYSFILDDNGNVYARKYANKSYIQSGVYTNSPMYFPNGISFDYAWPEKYFTDLVVFYDATKGCLYMALGNSGLVLPLVISSFMGPPPATYTRINAMDKQLVYMGNIRLGKGTAKYCLIYKDSESRYWRQQIQAMDQQRTTMTMLDTSMNPEVVMDGSANMSDESVFYQLNRTANQMFYSGGAGNRTLYLYEHMANRSTVYYTFDSPIRTITDNLVFLPPSTHTILMVGLENGEFHFIGITPDDIAASEQSARLKHKVALGQGVPVSTIYKCGFGYTQMQ